MNFIRRMLSGETKGQSDGHVVIPRTEPGWNINAESYFRKELEPLAGTEITVILQTVDEQHGGWDETNLLYQGGKVGQLPNTYHQRLGPILRKLRAEERQLECTAHVSKELELTLLAPFPEKLIPFLGGVSVEGTLGFESDEKQSIRVKESAKYQATLRTIWEAMDSSDWSGSASCKKYNHAGGKYDGQEGIEVFVEGARIGSIGPRYVEDLAPILERLSRGETEFECRISLSKFEESKLYATLFA